MAGKLNRSVSATQGSTISIHNVSYVVDVSVPGKICAKAPKDVLQDVSGIFKPGMNAILGPTGSGKSSLLDVIAGRKDPRGLSGTLLVDGQQQPKNFKCMTGYVVQDDVVVGTLTIRENLMFSANLRFPTSMPTSEKEHRVDETIRELGLEKCADSKVGTPFIRGVSGGERKRTNIGMELIISPSVLFLDEPTTGLDASTANSVMELLNNLSRRGRTIIFSIHQPRYAIYRQFDRLTLLSQGRTVFHGSTDDVLDFFTENGYQIEAFNNPPDFFLDVILGTAKPGKSDGENSNGNNIYGSKTITNEDGTEITSFSENNPDTTVVNMGSSNGVMPASGSSALTETEISERLHNSYIRSAWWKEVKAETDPIYDDYMRKAEKGENDTRLVGEYATSFATQVKYISKRTFLNNIRNPATTVMQVFMIILMSVINGLIYLRIDNSLQSGVQNRVGAFFFITMNQVFSNSAAVAIFIEERVIFVHENISGFYRVSSYFVSKILCDIIPMRLLPTTIYAIVVYFMIGFNLSASKFFIFYLTMFLTTISAAGVAFVASCLSRVFQVANLICLLIYILMMIFAGLLVNLASIGDWLSWLKYFSLFRYSLAALSINELKDMEFCETIETASGPVEICDSTIGNEYLEIQGINYETTWDLWQNHVALACMSVILLTLSFILLIVMKKLK